MAVAIVLGAIVIALGARPARATPYDNIPVGDPIEDELRILDLYPSATLQGRIRLPHLNTRPLQAIELQGIGPAPEALPATESISLARLERVLGRDRSPLFGPHPRYESTPRLFDSGSSRTSLQISMGVEGTDQLHDHTSRLVSGSGVGGRIALGLDRLQAFTHYILGRFDNARRFSDPIVPNNDVIVLTDEAYLSYTDEQGLWAMQFGRNRWNWGPGEEGSLVLSKTSPAITGLTFRAHHQALHADGIALNATLEQAAGEQLAAHRIEWQLSDAFRAGVTEAARYKASGWQPLYLIGIIPYVLVQRLESQAEPDSLRAIRNNVVMSFDAAWRIAPGTRLYGELLLDDVHARSAKTPNKFGYQFGWDGAGIIGGSRVTWGGEWTRISRYVYTSFFGRDYVTQGQPIGFPTGPDVRRVRLRLGWDPSPDWTVFATALHNDKGENEISDPFIPGSGTVQASHFQGVIENTRELDVGLRWWPASGVLISASGGYEWIRNDQHVTGVRDQGPVATLQLRLDR